MINLVKPAILNKPVEIIIHAGCNDLLNNTNPLSNIKKITKLVKTEAPELCKLTFSSILIRKYRKDAREKLISETNKHKKLLRKIIVDLLTIQI